MHELAITQNILDIALDKAKEVPANKVTRINVVIGELSGAVGDSVQFYFDFLSKGTAAEDATLGFTQVPAQLRCRDCGQTFHPDDIPWQCTNCHGLSVEVVAGQELYMESIEVV